MTDDFPSLIYSKDSAQPRIARITLNRPHRLNAINRVMPGESCVLTGGCLVGGRDYPATGIVEQDAPHFSADWDRLSLHQRQVLQAVARSGGRNMFAGEFLTTHRLGSHSSVQTSLRQLLKGQVLAKANGEYRFADPFFREWVALRLP